MAKSLRDRLEQYRIQNEEFIVLHCGLSKYRSLRVFLIDTNTTPLIYDIIVLKKPKKTTKSKKEENILKLKADLGALTESEKSDIQLHVTTQIEFLNNPFFYVDVEELISDLNFKNYMRVLFNIALLSDGTAIESFLEVEEETNEIFVCSIQSEDQRRNAMKVVGKVMEDMKIPGLFYAMYKHVLDKQAIQLRLDNFTETTEFLPDTHTSVPHNSKISPLKTRIRSEDAPKLIKFSTNLNRSPLRKANSDKPVLPLLPQRYAIDKKDFKDSPLRYLFYDAYKFPVIEQRRRSSNPPVPKRKSPSPRKVDSNVKEECKRLKRELKGLKGSESTRNTSQLPKKSKDVRFLSVKARNKFSLDREIVQTIKTQNKEFHTISALGLENNLGGKKAIGNVEGLQTIYKENEYLKNILKTFGYSVEKLNHILKQYLLLFKVNEFLKAHPSTINDEDKKELVIERLLEMTKLTKGEFADYLKYADYGKFKIHTSLAKAFLSKFRKMPESLFNRILTAADIGLEILFKDYAKLRYYFVDFKATEAEYVKFGLKFFEYANTNLSNVHNILKLALVREENATKDSMLLKALVTNYLLCGIIDGEGRFDPTAFEDAYNSEKMNIISFVKALLR